VSKQKVGVSEVEYGLAAGIYRAVYENADGTLFQGPGRSILLHTSRGFLIQSGGVFVSRQVGEPPRLYVLAHQDFQYFPDLAGAQEAQRVAVGSTAGTGSLTPLDTTQVNLGAPPNTVPQAAGQSIGYAIVGALAAADIEKERGKPLSMFHVDNEVLRIAIAKRGTGN
jgi:hypothetical protein